ncbi:MAG TPA: MFS transporter [Gammaproteobacteria bacterium]|nr:MFS transporter [Gammaproteobacteria bacterium]
MVGPIRESFQISDTQYSLLAGLAFSLFYAIMGLPLARIADRSSRRNLIVVGIAVWSFMTAACGLAKGYWSLFVARVGVGIGEATLGPAAYSMIADYFPKSILGRALSVYMIGVTLGSGFAYMLGGAVVGYVEDMGTIMVPVVGEIEGWQLTFFVVGIPGLLVSLLMLTTVREPARTGIVTPEAVPVSEVADYLWQRRRAYGGHILGISIFIMVVYALNLWGPTYFIRTFGYTRPEAGWVFGLVMIGSGTVGLLLAGTLSDRLVSKGIHDAYVKIILFSMVAMIPSAAALAFLESDLLAIVFMSLAVFFSAFQGGLAGGTLQLMTPNRMRGQVMAVYGLSSNLIGLGLGPTVIAMTTDYVFGYDGAIGKSIALCAVILCPIGALILWRSLPAIGEQLAEQREAEGG